MHNISIPLLLLATTACASSGATKMTDTPGKSAAATRAVIERNEVEIAQRSWCEALLSISDASQKNRDAKTIAQQVLSTAYDYDRGPVLFKPTLTSGQQTFRMTKDGALAYFVGGDPLYPDDSGFARKPWVACEPAIVNIVALSGDAALAMGNVTLTDTSGTQVKVDKSFGYRRGPDGNLRIVLHHSSLPYTPPSVTTAGAK